MRMVAYLRVSTDEQSQSGAGLKAQTDACQACADRAGVPLIGPFADEGVSGASGLDKRPALIEALGLLEPGDVLLVAKRDRLGRDPIAVAMIEAAVERKGSRVVSAAGEGTDGDDPTSILMRRMVDAFAEYERLVIKARTRAALQAKRRRGERTGGVPFGHDLAEDGVALVENAAELEALETIRRLRAAGLSLRAIAAELDRLGIPPKQGGPAWKHTAVQKLLNRPS
jgi:site-specific DNA recombinase